MTQPNRQLPPPVEYADVDVMEESGSPQAAIRIRKALIALKRFWWLPVLTLALGVSGGYALSRYIPTSYVSTAQMWDAVKIKLPESSMFSEDPQTFLGTQTELLKSPTVQGLAIDRLRLAATNLTIPLGKDGKPAPVSVAMRQASKSAAVYVLTATGPEPAYTQAFLDSVIQAYLEYKQDVRKMITGDTLASIAEQVQKSERDLREAQDRFTAYQRTNNLAILQQEGTAAGGYLAQLRTRLADLELELQLLTAVDARGTNAASASATPPTTNLLGGWFQSSQVTGMSLSGAVPAEVQVALRELEVLQSQRDRLSRYLRPKHPKIVKLNSDIGQVEGLLAIYRRQNQEQLASARRGIELKIANVRASIAEWEGKVLESNTRIAEAERLRLLVQRAQSVNDRLNVIVQNVGISRNIDQDTLTVLESAGPAEPSNRDKITAVAGCSLGGLLLGLGLIALISLRDDRVATHAELTSAFGGVVVGHVPEMPAVKAGKTLPLLQLEDSRHTYAESYRSLRSALLYLNQEHPRPRVLLVTSAVPSEGKSTIAVNLARTLAFGGARVLLIDADLRKGRLHDILGGRREPGFSDLLRHPDLLEDALQTDSLPNLTYVACGGEVGNPGDLLLAASFGQVIGRFRERFDYVLIDSSPVFAADDASTIAPQVDGTVFVVRRGYSRSGVVQEALGALLQRQARVLGLVFNRADASHRSYHYYKYGDYYRKAASA